MHGNRQFFSQDINYASVATNAKKNLFHTVCYYATSVQLILSEGTFNRVAQIDRLAFILFFQNWKMDVQNQIANLASSLVRSITVYVGSE